MIAQKLARLQAQGKNVLYAAQVLADNTYRRISDDLDRVYPQPRWRLDINGETMSLPLTNRLMSLSLTDNRGLSADVLEFSLSDHDGLLQIPAKKAVVELWLGWHTGDLVYKGAFLVNEISHTGTPDVLSIRAMSADLKDAIKQKKERSFSQLTLGKLVEQIAHEHSLIAQVSASLADKFIYHIDQNESDINLLTRLAEEFDATAVIKDDHLLFMPIGEHKTVGGVDLPVMLIDRRLGDNHDYAEISEDITGVRTYFYDVDKKDKVAVLAGNEDEMVKEIRYVHRDKQSAIDTAIATYRKAQRDTAQLRYTLALGDPRLIPNMPVLVVNLKPQIDAIDWTLVNVKHELGEDGYTCQIELERSLGEIGEIMPPITIGEPDDNKQEKNPQKPNEQTAKPRSKSAKKYRQRKAKAAKAKSTKK